MIKRLLLVPVCICLVMTGWSQTQEELLARKMAKEAELAALVPQYDAFTAQVDALKKEITELTDLTTPLSSLECRRSWKCGF